MDKNVKHYPLNVTMPQHCAYVVRDLPQATVEQRERALNATHWNEFAFPSGMLTVDMLSDSGTTAMTNQQWATLFLGDEAYGRNTGYYVLLDTFRDIFERGGEKNWKKIIDLVRTDCRDIEKMMDEVYLCEYEGGLFNGGAAQMERPNAFIIQQGRAAESVLMEIVKKILAQRHPGKVFTIPSNGHFDTTEGNIKQMGSIPRNLYNKELLYEIPEGGSYEKNPFKGNMDIEKLEQLIARPWVPKNVPLVFTCITNNPICGQPVSMANIREINRVAHKYDIPLVLRCGSLGRELLLHQDERGRLRRQVHRRDRQRDVLLLRRLHHVRQEGRPRQHGRYAGLPRPRPVLEEVLRLQRGRHREDRRGRAHQGQADLLLRQRLLRRHVRP